MVEAKTDSVRPLFPKTLRRAAADKLAETSPSILQGLVGTVLPDDKAFQKEPTMYFNSKFFKCKTVLQDQQAKSALKVSNKDTPSVIVWFTKVLKRDDRALICSCVDREIVSII